MSQGDGGSMADPLPDNVTPPSKPFNRRHIKKLYEPQSSPLDSESLKDLWGFVNLFWLGISWYGARTMWQNYTESGRPIELRILFDLGVSVERLALADAAMVASLFLCVPFEKAQIAGWIPRGAGFYIQHAIQTAFFFFWTWIIWVSDWTFFQNGILAMHMLTMLMKVHSYLVTNRELWFKQKGLAGLKKKLEELDSGRHKHKGHGGKLPKDESDELADVKDRIEQLEEALFPADGVSYPQNVTFANFLDFLRIPFLVYSLSYPRTAKIRWGYFFEKAAGFFGTIILTYLVISSFILPNLQEANNISVFELIGRLLFPMLIVYVLIFLMVWEYVTNCFAELSRFADRGFYGDWWNSTDFAHFSRTWNKPVYAFLLRHVYGDALKTGLFSKPRAALLTFLLSSIFHEVVLTLTTKRFRPVVFFFQMAQLPLTTICNALFSKKYARLTNAFWWAGMALGFPIISILYVRDLHLKF